MKISMRNYQGEADYWRIREFLREVFLLNNRHDYSWCLLRWDYWRWHVNMNIYHLKLEDVVTLWEANGQIVAMVNPDHPDEVFFQVHPSYHSKELLCEMLDVAEAKLPNHKEGGSKELLAWVNEADVVFKDILTQRGFMRSKFNAEHMRRRLFTQPVPDSVAPGRI